MAEVKLPYMTTPGLVPKILQKVQEAKRPDRFTQDFLETKLGHSGGSAMPFIPLLKRLGFLASDGTPTRLYDKFRNSTTQGAAMAEGMRSAYAPLFERNEYAADLSKEKLQSLVVEVTGAAHDDRTVVFTLSTFLALKNFADFEAKGDGGGADREAPSAPSSDPSRQLPVHAAQQGGVGLNLAYTINLVLPETTNAEVFNAIFKSLRDNLLARS